MPAMSVSSTRRSLLAATVFVRAGTRGGILAGRGATSRVSTLLTGSENWNAVSGLRFPLPSEMPVRPSQTWGRTKVAQRFTANTGRIV